MRLGPATRRVGGSIHLQSPSHFGEMLWTALVLGVTFSMFIGGCHTKTDPCEGSNRADLCTEGLSDAEEAVLETVPYYPPPTLNEIVLSGGESLAAYLSRRGIVVPEESGSNQSLFASQHTHLATQLPPTATLPAASSPNQRRQDIISLWIAAAVSYSAHDKIFPEENAAYGNSVCCSTGAASAECCGVPVWQSGQICCSGEPAPAQTGLAYVYGDRKGTRRDSNRRRQSIVRDVTHPEAACPEYLYGLDCSGLIDRLASLVLVGMPPLDLKAIWQVDPNEWNVRLDSTWQIKMTVVTDGTREPGDIVGWPTHIGIVVPGPSGEGVISSMGQPDRPHCATNRDDHHGPRWDPMPEIVKIKKEAPTKRLRLKALCGNVPVAPGNICCDDDTQGMSCCRIGDRTTALTPGKVCCPDGTQATSCCGSEPFWTGQTCCNGLLTAGDQICSPPAEGSIICGGYAAPPGWGCIECESGVPSLVPPGTTSKCCGRCCVRGDVTCSAVGPACYQ